MMFKRSKRSGLQQCELFAAHNREVMRAVVRAAILEGAHVPVETQHPADTAHMERYEKLTIDGGVQ